MKRWFLAALLLLLLAVAVVVAIERDPGYVLVAYAGWTLETSVWIGLLLLLALVVVAWWLLRLVQSGSWRVQGLRRWLGQRHSRKVQRQTTQGLIALIEGNWQRARRLLERAAAESETPLVNYLMAARAAAAEGDQPGVRNLLRRAERSTSGAGIAVELTQAELQLERGQLEESLATLQRARRNAGRNPRVLQLLMRVYLGLGDWPNLIALLPELRRHHVAPEEELRLLERRAWAGRLRDAGARAEQPERALAAVWQALPRALRRDPELVRVHVEQLLAHGLKDAAENALRRQLDRSWDPGLIALYGRVAGPDPRRQLLVAERWLAERAGDPALLLCLGRLSLRNQLWGKARDYFESSLRLEDRPETCAELGRLLAHLGEHDLASRYYQRGLMSTTQGLPELPLPVSHRVGA